jgi:hypothetical protein
MIMSDSARVFSEFIIRVITPQCGFGEKKVPIYSELFLIPSNLETYEAGETT